MIAFLSGCLALSGCEHRESADNSSEAQGSTGSLLRRGFTSNSKDRAVRIVAHQQRAILGDCYSSWPAPNTLGIENEPRQKVFVLAGRLAILQPGPDARAGRAAA